MQNSPPKLDAQGNRVEYMQEVRERVEVEAGEWQVVPDKPRRVGSLGFMQVDHSEK